MKTTKVSRFALAVLMLIVLFACAPSEVYKIGQDMMAQNRPDDAIGYFEQALREEPDNKEYQDSLLQAKEAAAKGHYTKARRLLGSTPEVTFATLEQVVKEADLAFKLDPKNAEIAAFQKQAQTRMRTFQENLKALYAQAEQDMAKEDWVAAVTKLRQINRLFPNYEETGARLLKAEQEGSKAFYQQGIQLGQQEDWKMASLAFKNVLDINPNYMDAARLYEEAKGKDNAGYYLKRAEEAVQRSEWPRAVLLLEKALEYNPDDAAVAKKLDDVKQKAARVYFEEARRQIDRGQLYGAVKGMNLARTYLPFIQGEAPYKEALKTLTGKLMERADKFAERELWGNALVWLQNVELLNPSHPDLFQKMIDVRDRINKRIRKSIAVFDFGSPSNNKDAGRIVADKLMTFLHKNASGDLRIIERENLQSILREMQLGQTGIVDIKSAQTVGKMRGIDTFIMGNVLHYSAKMTDNPSTAQVKVLVDEEEVPNPEFQTWLILHQRPTEEEWKTAPPRTMKKKNYQFVSYRQGVAKINAIFEISYKLVDTLSGENIFTNTIAGRTVKEDKYQDAVPMANIVHDPLELPTETEVLDDLTNAKVTEMGQSVLKHFQSLETVYFNEAQLHQKRRNFEQAVEKYMDAVFDEKLKGITTPITKKSLESIDKLMQNM